MTQQYSFLESSPVGKTGVEELSDILVRYVAAHFRRFDAGVGGVLRLRAVSGGIGAGVDVVHGER